ncbi:MAG TPA: hypothetical protein VMW10_01245 [Alphaproteobacteria bacterium]|nr:hypothetical protein [Alphaproteobacteria bacterium]
MKKITYAIIITTALLGSFSSANAASSHFQTAHFYGLHQAAHQAAIAHMTAGVPIPSSAVDHARLMVTRPEAYTPDLSGGPRGGLGCDGSPYSEGC